MRLVYMMITYMVSRGVKPCFMQTDTKLGHTSKRGDRGV